jgi:hypothetical protein
MGAVARNLGCIAGVFAILTAILVVRPGETFASRVSALVVLRHDTFLLG